LSDRPGTDRRHPPARHGMREGGGMPRVTRHTKRREFFLLPPFFLRRRPRAGAQETYGLYVYRGDRIGTRDCSSQRIEGRPTATAFRPRHGVVAFLRDTPHGVTRPPAKPEQKWQVVVG